MTIKICNLLPVKTEQEKVIIEYWKGRHKRINTVLLEKVKLAKQNK